jgi:hypothetical protein
MLLLTTGRLLIGLLLLTVMPGMDLVYAQEQPGPPKEAPPSSPVTSTIPPSFKELTSQRPGATCLEPDKLPGMSQYDGPMKKTVGMFAHALERGSVFTGPTDQGTMLCKFGVKDKFFMFLEGSVDPMLLLTAGFDAGVDHATNRDPTFGMGAEGYGKRYLASYMDWQSGRFFRGFLYPVIFNEDPRYYRLGQGPTKKRLIHAATHVFVAHHPDGTHTFNYSEWIGSASSAALSNVYHPGNAFTTGQMASTMAFQIGFDAGFDVMREFWPEIARKLKLPFRGIKQKPINPGSE